MSLIEVMIASVVFMLGFLAFHQSSVFSLDMMTKGTTIAKDVDKLVSAYNQTEESALLANTSLGEIQLIVKKTDRVNEKILDKITVKFGKFEKEDYAIFYLRENP